MTRLGLSQLQLQLSGLHCGNHGMCASLQCVIQSITSDDSITALLVFYGYNIDLCAVCNLSL